MDGNGMDPEARAEQAAVPVLDGVVVLAGG